MSARKLRLVKSAEDLTGTTDEPGLPPFPVVYQQYCRYVARIASRLLGSEDEVRDVVQDVFLTAMQKLDEVENTRSLKSWLASVTVNNVISRLRWRKVRSVLKLQNEAATLAPPLTANPEQAATLRQVYAELNRLPIKQRVAWTLRYVEEEPLEDVARICGCSLATAKRWIAAAQRALRGMDDDADE